MQAPEVLEEIASGLAKLKVEKRITRNLGVGEQVYDGIPENE